MKKISTLTLKKIFLEDSKKKILQDSKNMKKIPTSFQPLVTKLQHFLRFKYI